MAKYYSGINEGETLDSMLANGSTYGISPSQTIDCSSVIADTNIGIGTVNPTSLLHLNSGEPIIRLSKTDGATNNKHWNIAANTVNLLRLQAINDDGGGGGQLFDFYRSDGDIQELRGMNAGSYWFTVNNSTKLVKGTLHTLIGEHSGATAAGQLFSFGNGATDNEGPAMPFAGEVVVVTISKSGGTNAGIFQPSKNGVTQGSASDQITTTTGSGSVTKNNANYTSLMNFAAGDRINYVTIDDTDTTTCLTMVVRFNP